MRYEHSQVIPYSCQFLNCKFITYTLRHFNNHLRKIHGKMGIIHGSTVRSDKPLTDSHERLQNVEIKSFACKESFACKYQTDKQYLFREHMKIKHSEIKKLKKIQM